MDSQLGKYLILIGGAILIIGVIVYFFGNGLKWIGHLPGDIRIEKANFSFYFPITTLIIINLVIYLILRIWRWIN